MTDQLALPLAPDREAQLQHYSMLDTLACELQACSTLTLQQERILGEMRLRLQLMAAGVIAGR